MNTDEHRYKSSVFICVHLWLKKSDLWRGENIMTNDRCRPVRRLLVVGVVLSLALGCVLAQEEPEVQQSFPVGPNPRGIVVGDFNGDGFMDIAVTIFGNGRTPNHVAIFLWRDYPQYEFEE